jgi:TRAP-type C4-dicarboxylate transport system permease small subunit
MAKAKRKTTPETGELAVAAALRQASIIFAYIGGAIVAMIGTMSTISIIGRGVFVRPITGDFELVEFGTAVAGAMFLPYCQATFGHISVDLFTIKASQRTRDRLDQFGCLLMGVMYALLVWRTGTGTFDIFRSHETTMLMGLPIWIGYMLMIPGLFLAAAIAFVQTAGISVAGRTHE